MKLFDMNRYRHYLKPLAFIIGAGTLACAMAILAAMPFYAYRPAATAGDAGRIPDRSSPKKFSYQAKHRDPFQPAGVALALRPEPASPGYRLKGVVWDAKRPLAVIMDNQGVTILVRQGEKIGGDRLVSITQSNAVLARPNGSRYELKTWE